MERWRREERDPLHRQHHRLNYAYTDLDTNAGNNTLEQTQKNIEKKNMITPKWSIPRSLYMTRNVFQK